MPEVTQRREEATYRGAPEPGQLVKVRHRQWIVSDVIGSHAATTNRRQHVVMLSSVDADALDEKLQVIWEIEPGAQIIERAGLPAITGKDDTETLEAFLDAVRWGAATNADRGSLQSPFRSGISIEDYQLEPVARAIDMARVNLLIADDVGLGKTIEAGLVIQELSLRHRARKVLIVCPASLQEKWRGEMQEKFGLEFKIVDSTYVKELRRKRGLHANPWASFPRLITSIDWLKSGEPLRMLRDRLPAKAVYPREFDILVVDEAHNAAPAGSANYVLESDRTNLIRSIAPHFQHRLFLTATPHNGYTQSFTSLLELLDDQRFSRNIEPDPKQLARVLIRRLKSTLVDDEGKPIYPKRVLLPLSIEYSDEEREIHGLLAKYSASREVTCRGSGMATTFVNGLLKKRLLSSPAAFASTLEKHYLTLTRTDAAQDPRANTQGILKTLLQKAEEDYADDAEVESVQEEAIEEATKRTAPLTPQEAELMEQMRHWARRHMQRPDSKAKAVVAWIKENLGVEAGWNGKKVILFTEYRTTLRWLQEMLAAHHISGERLTVIHGEIDHDEREKIKAGFQAHPDRSPVRILLATDAAAEGIDLQNYCHYLIHVEIPYNPNVMEQRNGRIDRHGQKSSEVHIWHPVDGGDTSGKPPICGHEDDIIRALKKLENMREDMGSVNPVIAPQMSALIEGKRKEIDTKAAEERSKKVRRAIPVEAKFRERTKALHHKLMETRDDFHLTPDRVLRAVTVGMALAGKPALKPIDVEAAPKGTVFEVPQLTSSWAQCLEGLKDPLDPNKQRLITFDHDVARKNEDVVLVHLNHRLVQMCLRTMREEVWRPDADKKIHRIDVRQVEDGVIDHPAVVIVSRAMITGGGHHRLHEELIVTGGYLKDKSFSRETRVATVEKWLDSAKPHPQGGQQLQSLSDTFTKHLDSLEAMVTARANERQESLEIVLKSKEAKEKQDIIEVLDELHKTISQELGRGEPGQFELFTPDERTQLKRDEDALKMRLDRIAEEKQREVEEIGRRYEKMSCRTFPLAVIFIIPKSFKGMGAK